MKPPCNKDRSPDSYIGGFKISQNGLTTDTMANKESIFIGLTDFSRNMVHPRVDHRFIWIGHERYFDDKISPLQFFFEPWKPCFIRGSTPTMYDKNAFHEH